MRVGIVGGGLMGMALARRYAADGHEVTVVEYAEHSGGCVAWSDFVGITADRFCHAIVPSDQNLIGFLKDLGVEDQVEWQQTYAGVYVGEKLHSISSSDDLFKSPLLSLISKLRQRIAMRRLSRMSTLKLNESTTGEKWLTKISGSEGFAKLWRPLLLANLGSGYSRFSAVFIRSYIERLLSAYDTSTNTIRLGYIRGGYEKIFRNIEKQIKSNGGRVLLKETVLRVSTGSDGLFVHTPQRKLTFDEVVYTTSADALERIVDSELLDMADKDRGQVNSQINSTPVTVKEHGTLEYIGVVCVVLVSRKPVTRYGMVGISDESIPFTSMCGMNRVYAKNTAGFHLTYLSRHLLSTDPEFAKPDSYFQQTFLDGIKRMFPEFPMQDIVSSYVYRAANVQPLQAQNDFPLAPSVGTSHPGLYVLNSSQFVNRVVNNNEVIGAVNTFYESKT